MFRYIPSHERRFMRQEEKELFEKAVYFENRGFNQEAEEVYFKLLRKDNLTFSMIERMSRFFQARDELHLMKKQIRKAITDEGGTESLGSYYLEIVSGDQEVKEVEWLLQQVRDRYTELSFRCFRFLSQHEKEMNHSFASLYERITDLFQQRGTEFSSLYVEATLFIAEIECERRCIPKARFHIRKLIALEHQYISFFNEIAAWVIYLDLVDELFKRNDFIRLQKDLSKELIIWLEYAKELSEGKDTALLAEQFVQITPPALLEKKQVVYLLFAKMQRKEVISEEEMVWLKRRPFDWLAVLLCITQEGIQAYAFLKNVFQHHADLQECVKTIHILTEAMKRKRPAVKPTIHVTVCGGGNKIGGMSILLSIDGRHLLLDAGIHVNDEERLFPDYTSLSKQGISFNDIDGLVVSHAHLDHTGAIPFVHKRNRRMPIIATEPTIKLMHILLRDLWKNQQSTDGFYSEEELQSALNHIEPVEFSTLFILPSGDGSPWHITLYPAGHILGAAAVHIERNGASILFTGDYSITPQLTVGGLSLPEQLTADLVITESTYGFMPSSASVPLQYQKKEFMRFIQQAISRQGVVLVPSFAIGRAQEVMLMIKEYFQNQRILPFPVYLDGLVPNVCKVYEQYIPNHPLQKKNESLFFGGGVRTVSDPLKKQDFESFYQQHIDQKPAVVIASSGMMQEGSSSARYAEKIIGNPNHSIVLTGYVDAKSPAYALQKAHTQNSGKVKLYQQDVLIQADIQSFRFSAHASREQIAETVISLLPKAVLLVHGESKKKYEMAKTVKTHVLFPTIKQLLDPLPFQTISAQNGESYDI